MKINNEGYLKGIYHLMDHPDEIRQIIKEKSKLQERWHQVMHDTVLNPGDRVRFVWEGRVEERVLDEIAIAQKKIPAPAHGCIVFLVETSVYR